MSGLSWLGAPEARLHGVPARFETRKTAALLAYLSIVGRPVSRESLSALFWPDFDRERAPANLRRALFSLSKMLGPGVLTADRDTVRLEKTADVFVDVLEFRRLVGDVRGDAATGHAATGHAATGDAHEAGTECPDCRAALEAALGLCKGDFLEGFSLKDAPSFGDWQASQADELRHELEWVRRRLLPPRLGRDEGTRAESRGRRPRLLSLMDRATRLPLTLVSAPAGWGKSTLVAEWARESGEAVVGATQDMVMRGLWNTVIAWIDKLPPGLVRAWPELCLQKAEALVFAGRIREAEASATDMENALARISHAEGAPDKRRYLEGAAAILRAVLC